MTQPELPRPGSIELVRFREAEVRAAAQMWHTDPDANAAWLHDAVERWQDAQVAFVAETRRVAREARRGQSHLAAGEMMPTPQEFADHAMTEGLTRADLRKLLDQVHRAGYDGAGVKDSTGETFGLRDLIFSIGQKAAA